MSQTQQLVLTTTSLHNVVIANASDDIFYEVVTPRWAPQRTTISRLDPYTREFDVVAEVTNERRRPVGVRMYDGAVKPVDEFLAADMAGTTVGRFRGKEGRGYLWRVRQQRHLELVREDGLEEKPVAVYHRHKRHLLILKMSRHPYIEVDNSLIDSLDALILSFLLIEYKRRHGDS